MVSRIYEPDIQAAMDRWGFSRQITPRRLLDLTTSSDRDKARCAFAAMMTMAKIDIARIEAAAEAA
jgi:predicted 3-demethylubiquinone-9 3-methyltransferase (glyoxalase superfamily)